jgi:hypothetical protein
MKKKKDLVWKRHELNYNAPNTPGYKPKTSNVIKMRSAASEVKHLVTASPY